MKRLSDNTIGALIMCLSMASFATNDAIMKYISTDIGIYQSIFVRGCFASLLISLFAIQKGVFYRLPSITHHQIIIWRTIAEIGATLAFLTALYYTPLPHIIAVLQALPLTVTLAAALFLGERIGWRRGLAITIGLSGTIMIIQPWTADFNVYIILGIITVGFVTMRDIITRRLPARISSLYIAFLTAVAVTITGGFLTLFYEGWVSLSLIQLFLLGVAGSLILTGYLSAISAMRIGEISFVTPFRYTVMIWAIGLGYFIWHDIPDHLMLFGLAIVIATGFFTFWREQIKNR